LMQADLLFRSYPSPDRVDFGEHPDGSDGCRARHFDVANSLEDGLTHLEAILGCKKDTQAQVFHFIAEEKTHEQS